MRIVGGKFAGRDLTSPEQRVRATAEHVRVAIMVAIGPALTGARMLELFAGSGAVGLEALSRGAAKVDFVESRPGSLHSLKANVATLRMTSRTRVFIRDALEFVTTLKPDSYDIAFADPPYESKMLDRVVVGWLRAPYSPLLIVEHARAHKLPKGERKIELGDTTLTVYAAPRSPEAP
ncbi:MAG: hypothetical protein JWO05_210 [Gemmatimonadetes bacterium]|nr:hypothetical protein [Gemmatimonadota bacterium]